MVAFNILNHGQENESRVLIDDAYSLRKVSQCFRPIRREIHDCGHLYPGHGPRVDRGTQDVGEWRTKALTKRQEEEEALLHAFESPQRVRLRREHHGPSKSLFTIT